MLWNDPTDGLPGRRTPFPQRQSASGQKKPDGFRGLSPIDFVFRVRQCVPRLRIARLIAGRCLWTA